MKLICLYHDCHLSEGHPGQSGRHLLVGEKGAVPRKRAALHRAALHHNQRQKQ